MSKRDEINQHHEEIAISVVSEEWMCAIEIAKKIGMVEQWRIVACALRRLVDKGVVEMDVVKTGRTKSRAYEHQTVYRVAGVSRGMLPHWLEPRMPELKVIKRQVFRSRK